MDPVISVKGDPGISLDPRSQVTTCPSWMGLGPKSDRGIFANFRAQNRSSKLFKVVLTILLGQPNFRISLDPESPMPYMRVSKLYS